MRVITALECLQRLRCLQSLCVSLELDCLLLVGGIDGRHHAGAKETLGWLLGGVSGRDLFASRVGLLDVEEIVIVIMPDAIRMYCPPKVNDELAERLSRWTRLQAWVPKIELLDDTEELERNKIVSFIQMLKGLKRVGVPVSSSGSTGSTANGPSASVEAWPLVQAFALQELESLTGGGFFVRRDRLSPTPNRASPCRARVLASHAMARIVSPQHRHNAILC